MGRKKRNNSGLNSEEELLKRPKPETGETYLVKKYRAERTYAAMDAFVRYTKSHRMLDASYIRWSVGVTPEKPFVFSTRVGGTDLGWGRGKTREAAIDCAVRAAFALVNAHGYKNFPLDEDCLMEAPIDLPPPPPSMLVPPPLPPGLLPPYMHNLPPPPPGLPPPPPPGLLAPPPPPPPAADIIPQPKLSQQAPAASSLLMHSANSATTVTPAPVIMSFNSNKGQPSPSLKQLKGGLTLVFDPASEGPDEVSMEELRAGQPRYQKMLIRAAVAAKAVPIW